MVQSLKTEEERLALIRSLDLLKIVDLPELKRMTQLVCEIFDMPMALISIVGEDHQYFISREGFPVSSTDRSASVCDFTIRGREVLEVEDMTQDPRFADNCLVVDAPHLRFYAGAPLITSSGYAIGALCVLDHKPRKLTEQQRHQLETLATLTIDQISLLRSVGRREPVTGLPNRQQFALDLAALADIRPYDRHTLMILDVFDVHAAHLLGQARGMAPVESLIRQIGERLSKLLSDIAPLYHVGVSRFAFVLSELSSDEREAILERIRLVATRSVLVDGLEMLPMCHGGITAFDASNAQDALRRALVAMHQALDQRQPWVRYEPTRDLQLRRDYRLAADLPAAIANDQLYLVFQPRVELATRRMVGVEALLRWKHDELGEVSPGEFVPVIERTALMPQVTDWVIRQSLSQMRTWIARGMNLALSLNVSPADFRRGDLPDRLLTQLRRTGLDPSHLEIEITEGEWLERTPEVSRQLSEISQMGVRIAVDDFGAGYSNFAYLTTLPINTIKIDRSLVQGFPSAIQKGAMVRSIIGLAHDLGFHTVAEGVETEEEAVALKTLRCREAQGFIFSRPLLPRDIDRLRQVA